MALQLPVELGRVLEAPTYTDSIAEVNAEKILAFPPCADNKSRTHCELCGKTPKEVSTGHRWTSGND